tara:strand:- start:405 stop:671 length:267 start_codon:yes stop_codon:yes gene_type:complete
MVSERKQMTEFSKGIVESIKNVIGYSSLTLALIFFVGHMIIAMTVVSLITGASIWEAGLVAVVEPAINSVWFYVLHIIYRSATSKKTT